MKFRSDFVTNSSSSSYMVTLAVKPKNADIIDLDLCSDLMDDGACLELKSSVKNVTATIKSVSNVGELTEAIIEESVGGAVKEQIEFLEEDEEDEEEAADFKDEVQSAIESFREEMAKYSSLDELDSVIISEYYSGRGDSSYDTVVEYLARIHPEASEDEIEDMAEGYVSTEGPDGYVKTIIKLDDKSVREEHDLSGGW